MSDLLFSSNVKYETSNYSVLVIASRVIERPEFPERSDFQDKYRVLDDKLW